MQPNVCHKCGCATKLRLHACGKCTRTATGNAQSSLMRTCCAPDFQAVIDQLPHLFYIHARHVTSSKGCNCQSMARTQRVRAVDTSKGTGRYLGRQHQACISYSHKSKHQYNHADLLRLTLRCCCFILRFSWTVDVGCGTMACINAKRYHVPGPAQ